MIIQVNKKWRIVSEEQCWAVQERRTPDSKSKDGWKSIEWHAEPARALASLSERRVRRLSGTVEENRDELKQIVSDFRAVAERVEAAVSGGGAAA